MATKMAAACQFAVVDTICHLSPDFFKISYMDYLTVLVLVTLYLSIQNGILRHCHTQQLHEQNHH